MIIYGKRIKEMLKILTKEMMKDADSYTTSHVTTEIELILKAGKAVFSSYSFPGKTLIIIGKGNNGGDGLALAKYLKEDSKDVSILQLFKIEKEVLLNLLNECIELHIPVYEYNESFSFYGYDTFVDAIFGIGFRGDLEGIVRDVVLKINSFNSYTISIDINTGLDANSGKTNLAVKSDLTMAIGYLKPGHFLNDAKDYILKLVAVNIGIPYNKECYYLYTDRDLRKVFVERKINSHKGSFGYVGLMGGSIKYSGSIKLSNLALLSLIMGAGVSRLIVPSDISDSILPYLLESTLYPIESNSSGGFAFDLDSIESAIKGLDALSFGMGIGESKENTEILEYLLKNFKGKLLLDADGLNTL